MTTTQQTALQLPFPRENVLEISPLYALLRQDTPVVRVTTPAGDPAWLVIAHKEAAIAFSDRRLGYYVHEDPEHASRLTDAVMHSAPMGGVDFEAESLRLRRLMTPSLTPKRVRLLEEWVQQLADGCLDDLEAAHDANPAAPVDFHALVGYRLPVLVICALLGVPERDRDEVFGLAHRMGAYGTGDDPAIAMAELHQQMRRIIDEKRANLGDDVISDLIRAQEEDPSFFSTFPLEHYASGLVFAGHETTVARMDFGLLYLLTDTSRRDWLMEDPEGRVGETVEEILRMTSAHHLGLMRYALEDVELGGVTIGKGDLVVISEASANRDPLVFERPEESDPLRGAKGHLAFGYGAHVCIGQNLARAELRTVFTSVFERFTELRLAIDVAELHISSERFGGGVDRVPVTW
jgi:cytochrome P450